jgi:phosphatidylinositol alpha-1,6-mannosyltransferase
VQREPGRERVGRLEPGALPAWLADARPDVVLLSRASRRLAAVASVAARAAPLVVSVHELAGRHTRRGVVGRWRVRHRYGLDRARHIVVNSRDTGRRVASLRPRAPIEVVYPGVDTDTFAVDAELRRAARERLGLTGRRVLLTVSRLASNKGHARVIEALPALRARFPDLVYAVVGEGAERPALEKRAAERGVADAVRFEGRVADPRDHYAAADVFVMASGRAGAQKAGEGFGIVYAEAGACGLPVVASASGGGSDVVVDGETGRLVDPGAMGALEEALTGLLADPDTARRLGEAARRHCARFDWERGVEVLERVLARAAGRAA